MVINLAQSILLQQFQSVPGLEHTSLDWHVYSGEK